MASAGCLQGWCAQVSFQNGGPWWKGGICNPWFYQSYKAVNSTRERVLWRLQMLKNHKIFRQLCFSDTCNRWTKAVCVSCSCLFWVLVFFLLLNLFQFWGAWGFQLVWFQILTLPMMWIETWVLISTMTALERVLISARTPHGKYNFLHLTNNYKEDLRDLKTRTLVVQKRPSGQNLIPKYLN